MTGNYIRKKRPLSIILSVLVIVIVFFSCSDNPPAILENEWRMTLFSNRLLGVTYQKLSVFIRAEDKDGAEDLGALHIVNDDAELVWTIEAENWDAVQKKGNAWVGTNGIVMPDNSPFPVGSYRILLEDKGGKIVETPFYLKRQNVETKPSYLPEAKISGDTIEIIGAVTESEIWIYDTNDNFLFGMAVPDKTVQLKSIFSKNNETATGFSCYVSGKDRDGYYYLTNGPFYYSPEK